MIRKWTEELWTLTRNFQRFRQNCNLPVQKNNVIKSFFFRKNYFFKFTFGFWVKNFRPFAGKLPAGLSNLHSTSSLEHFGKIFFSEGRFLISEFSRPFAHKIWLLIENVSGRVVETTIYLSRRTFCGNFVPKYFVLLNHFSYLTNLLRPFCKKVSGRFVQTVFYLSKGNFLEDFLLKVFLSRYFSILIENFSVVWPKFFSRVVKAVFNLSKIKFLETFWKKLLFCFFFRFGAKTFRTSGKKFQAGFSKLHSMCQKDNLTN